MKQICTQIAALCLLIIGQNVYAQTVSSSTTAPSPLPAPGFGTPDSVKASNGFTSTNTGLNTFNEFAPFQTDTIMSPQYYYPGAQSTISFILNCSVSNVTTAAKVLIITATGDTISATSNSQNYQKASIDYYFTFDLGTVLPANTNFKIAVIMTLGNKAVAVNTLATNALKGAAQGPLPLPVTFAGFYAKNNNGYTSLTWNVGTESNISGYEIQKSTNGSSFSKIGFVTATNSYTYNFIDSKASDLAYYRIKSVDADGKYAYSIIVSVKGLQSEIVFKAFPMPVLNQLTVQHNITSGNSKIEIISADGRVVKSLALTQGIQQTSIDLSSAKAGVYVIRFVNGSNIQSAKIIKQ